MDSQFFYKFMSRLYDSLDITYFANYDKSPRRVVLQSINENEKVLDICTGTATNAIRIAKQKLGTKVIGIDLSNNMLKIAKEKLKKEEIKNVKLIRMDATSLTFNDKVFNKVLISLVLHELDDPLKNQIMAEAKRVLKDDGEIIITEWEISKEWWRRLLFLPVHLLEPKVYHSFIKKDLYRYFATMGLEVVDIVHCNYSKVLKLRICG